jgi:hypothetical protein
MPSMPFDLVSSNFAFTLDIIPPDELIKAVDEGFQSSETEQSLSVEEVRELIRQCATRSK